MTRWILAGLIVLNVLLGAGVYMRLAERSATAQIGAAKSDFAVVAGANNGGGIIYIMDATSGRILAIRTDPVNRQVSLAAARNIADDLARFR
jgi:hypothetical protein